MPIFHTNHGEKIYYIDENTAGSPVMLLFHGLGVNSRSWLLQIPAFSDAGYRILAPDLPGFGLSCNTRFTSFSQIASEIPPCNHTAD
jgi:pimeloyl-ACP methyl ester carboxylesterase